MVGVSMLLAVAIGIPLGILVTRRAGFRKPVTGGAIVMETIPSLALFGLLLPVPWCGARADRLAIIRYTYAGIQAVDPSIIEAGRGMGMTGWQILYQVQLPLSWSVIIAGVRVATVISVGVATIAAAVGAGGLGEFIFRGLSMVNNDLILAGAIPSAIMALVADLALGWLEQALKKG